MFANVATRQGNPPRAQRTQVERVVLNTSATNAALSPDIRACGEFFAIILRTSRSTYACGRCSRVSLTAANL
jgi:hypothetical protein